MVNVMEKVSWNTVKMEIIIQVTGWTVNVMDMVIWIIKMEIIIQVTGWMVNVMEKVQWPIRKEAYMKVIGKMIKGVELGNLVKKEKDM